MFFIMSLSESSVQKIWKKFEFSGIEANPEQSNSNVIFILEDPSSQQPRSI